MPPIAVAHCAAANALGRSLHDLKGGVRRGHFGKALEDLRQRPKSPRGRRGTGPVSSTRGGYLSKARGRPITDVIWPRRETVWPRRHPPGARQDGRERE